MNTTSFTGLMAEEQRAAGAHRLARAQHDKALASLGAALRVRLVEFREALCEELLTLEDDFDSLARLGECDYLEHWEFEGEHLLANFCGSFRGERYDVSVRVPRWLAADDWQERLQAEVSQRRARIAARDAAQACQAEADERATLMRLQAKYGPA